MSVVTIDDVNNATTVVAELGNIVTVWAHPDDEAYLAGGVMAIASHAGASVTCVTATSGELADTDSGRQAVGRMRRAELSAALDVLGVADRVLLDLPDGGLSAIDADDPVETISELLADRSPDTIITFGSDGFTGHPDHCAVGRWTHEAARRTSSHARVLHPAATRALVAAERDITDRFPIFEPGLPTIVEEDRVSVELGLSGRWLDTKVRALRAHASQTAALIDAIGEERFRAWVSVEVFVEATGVGESAARHPRLLQRR